ncbi:MAG: Peptidase propeptide [Edaphobacter sp.]|nr:Peptidase propeptide [Edaphobacter sp.]
MKRIRRVAPPFFLTALFSFSLFGFAQKPTPRLAGTITETSRATLAGSRSPGALPGQDMGAVSPEMTVPGITLVFKRSAAQENELQELLTAQQNPATSLYHHWLTPDTFAARFGIADEDLAATETWLQSRGFHIESTARGHDRITFSGNAAQVQAAFGTGLHYYRTEGELHFAPQSDLTLPTELASMTAAVLHISNFRPKPNVKVSTGVLPSYTTLSTQTHYLTPKDIITMYGLTGLYQNTFWGGGQSLAVVGQSFVDTSSSSKIREFQGNFTQATPVTAVLVPGSGVEAISPGDQGESEIDLEYASGIAQNANIFLVYVGANQNYDVFDALAFAITQDIAPVISISYGICESLMSAAELNQGNALFEEAAAQGQTLVAAAGDGGSTPCASYPSSTGITPAQQQALSVIYPADSPYVTAVGGTQMAAGTFAPGSSQYWSTASNIDSVSSLLSYVPEVVWNEGSTLHDIVAGGGGASSYFPRPTWQNSAPGIPSGTFRLLPDIALQSSVDSPGFLACSDDPNLIYAQGHISSCLQQPIGSSNPYTVAGGTSFAAPIFAGFVAILNQVEHTTGQGNINPILYNLASNPTSYAAIFHDITSGTDACLPSVAACPTAGQTQYAATTGYDEATGLGSVDFGKLAAAWPSTSALNLIATGVLLTPSKTSASPGDSVPIQIVVGSFYSPNGNSAPTGTVSISVDGSAVQPSLAFSATNPSQFNASTSYNLTAPSTAGSHLVTVNYPGDATHSPSVATYSVLVGNVIAGGGFSLSAGNLTVANGSSGGTQVTVTPTGGYSGRVVWSLTFSGSSGNLAACYAITSPLVSGTTTTKLTIGVAAACNASLPAERGNLRPIATRGAMNDRNPTPRHSAPIVTAFASLLAWSSLRGLRRKVSRPQLLVVTLLTSAGLVLTGCGGAKTSDGSSTPPPAPVSANYTVTLTGTDSVNAFVHASTSFTLTVN